MSKSKTIKFFISSTFKDFLKERNALQNFVFPRLKKLCQKDGFGFQPVDLRWGVLPETSDDNQTMKFCLNEVKRCSSEPEPNLLVLLGQRYGWGPLPSEIDANDFKKIINHYKIQDKSGLYLQSYPWPLGLLNQWYILDKNAIPSLYYLKDKKGVKEWNSIEKELKLALHYATKNNKKFEDFHKSATELEIRDALHQFDASKENTLVYLRSFNDKSDPEYYEDEKVSQDKLTTLKDDLRKETYEVLEKNNLNLELYKASDKDTKDFTKLSPDLKSFCIKIFRYYYKHIKQEIRGYKGNSTLSIELQEQEKFLDFKSKIVLGRDDEITEIKQFALNSEEQYYLLYGKSGSGKSSVMAKTIFDLTNEKSKEKLSDKYKVVFRLIGTTAHTTSPRDTYEHIYWKLTGEEEKPFVEPDDYKFYNQFRELLKTYDQKIIIFIDAVDQFSSYDSLSIFLEDLPENVKVVFSTLNGHQQEDNVDTLYYKRLIKSITKTRELEVLTDSNEDILNEWLVTAKRELTSDQKKYFLTQCKNKTPLYLRLAFIIAKEWKSSNINYKNDIQGNEQDLILKFFEKLHINHYHKDNLIQRVLGFISASKDGLSESELIDLLSSEKDILRNYERPDSSYPTLSKFPDAIFSRLYFHMQEFFTEKLIDGEMLITPFHRIIEETIKEKYYKDKAEDLHTKLADYFLTLQDRYKTWDERYHNLHMLSETPYQLFHAKDSKRLKEILFDLEFAGSVYDNHKQDSFRVIIEKAHKLKGITENEIYVWESFYREKDHLITKFDKETWRPHQSLFQLAYEDGMDSDISKMAKHLESEPENIDFIWLKNIKIPAYYTRKDIIKTIQAHIGKIIWIYQLESGHIVSYGDDNVAKVWNADGIIIHEISIDKNSIYSSINIKEIGRGKFILHLYKNEILINQLKRNGFFEKYGVKNTLISKARSTMSNINYEFLEWGGQDISLLLEEENALKSNNPESFFELKGGVEAYFNQIYSNYTNELLIYCDLEKNNYTEYNLQDNSFDEVLLVEEDYLLIFFKKTTQPMLLNVDDQNLYEFELSERLTNNTIKRDSRKKEPEIKTRKIILDDTITVLEGNNSGELIWSNQSNVEIIHTDYTLLIEEEILKETVISDNFSPDILKKYMANTKDEKSLAKEISLYEVDFDSDTDYEHYNSRYNLNLSFGTLSYDTNDYDTSAKAYAQGFHQYIKIHIETDTLQEVIFNHFGKIKNIFDMNNFIIIENEKNICILNFLKVMDKISQDSHFVDIEDEIIDKNTETIDLKNIKVDELSQDKKVLYTNLSTYIFGHNFQTLKLNIKNFPIQVIKFTSNNEYMSLSKQDLISLWDENGNLLTKAYLVGDVPYTHYNIINKL